MEQFDIETNIAKSISSKGSLKMKGAIKNEILFSECTWAISEAVKLF